MNSLIWFPSSWRIGCESKRGVWSEPGHCVFRGQLVPHQSGREAEARGSSQVNTGLRALKWQGGGCPFHNPVLPSRLVILWLLRAPLSYNVHNASQVMKTIYSRLCTLPHSLSSHAIHFREVFIKRQQIIDSPMAHPLEGARFPCPPGGASPEGCL